MASLPALTKSMKSYVNTDLLSPDKVFHEWKFNGETRAVRLLGASPNLLICEVFDQATRLTTHRSVRYPGEDRDKYAASIVKNMHPELGRNQTGSTCTAMLISNDVKHMQTWFSGKEGEVEVKLFQAPSKNWLWVALNTSTNKQGIWVWPESQLSPERVSEYVSSYFSKIQYNADGCPSAIQFNPKVPSEPLQPSQPSIGRPDPNQETVVRRWFIDEQKEVRVIRLGEKLEYELVVSSQVKARGPVPFPAYFSIEDILEQMLARKPIVREDNTVRFVKNTPEPKFKSQLDPDVFIDNNNWAITLADTILSTGRNPLRLGGHANILIETVQNDSYGMLRAHLASDSDIQCAMKNKGKVILEEYRFDFSKIKSHSVTWIRPKSQVTDMIDQVNYEIFQQENCARFVPLNLAAGSIFTLFEEERTYNCLTWAKAKLAWVGLSFQDKNFKLLELPRLQISGLREEVRLVVNYSMKDNVKAPIYMKESGIYSIHLENEIENLVNHSSWRILKIVPSDTIKGMYDSQTNFSLTESRNIEIYIQVKGKGSKKIDVTEIIKQKMKSLKIEKDEEAKTKHDEEFQKHKAILLEKNRKINQALREQGYSSGICLYEEPESCTIL